jgi:hypothetical protein
MARISSYPRDLQVEDNDAWIGTESSNRLTRNFTAKAVADYLNINAEVNIGGQMSFKWSDTQNGGKGTISKTGGGGSGAGFNTLTEIRLSKNELNGQDVVAFLTYLIGTDVLIGQGNEISQFGHYSLTNYIVDPNNAEYYIATIAYIGGNGVVATQGTQYTIIDFNIASGDKTFIFTQGVPANVWNIQHNLNKFPSVSVVDTSNTNVFSQVDYVDSNNLTITNTAQFAGKAYLN